MPTPSGLDGKLVSVNLHSSPVKVTEVELPDRLEHLVAEHFKRLQQELQQDYGDLRLRLEAVERHLEPETSRQASAASLESSRNANNANMQNNEDPSPSNPSTVEVKAEVDEKVEKVEKVEKEVEEITEVCFEESIWTVPMMLGLREPSFGWFDSIFAATLVLLNLAMQASFSAILLTRAFMGDDFETKIRGAEVWRTSVAHDFKHLDLADTSLVSRVCLGDEALILSTTQATLIDHINSFLGMDKEDFQQSAFQPGILLCMLCIVLWTLCVYKDRCSKVSAWELCELGLGGFRV